MTSATVSTTHVSDAELDRIRQALDAAALCSAMAPQIAIAVAKACPRRIERAEAEAEAESEAVVVLLSNVRAYSHLPADALPGNDDDGHAPTHRAR